MYCCIDSHDINLELNFFYIFFKYLQEILNKENKKYKFTV